MKETDSDKNSDRQYLFHSHKTMPVVCRPDLKQEVGKELEN